MTPSAFTRRGSSATAATPPSTSSSSAAARGAGIGISGGNAGGSVGGGHSSSPTYGNHTSAGAVPSSSNASTSASAILHSFPRLPAQHHASNTTLPSSQTTLRGGGSGAGSSASQTLNNTFVAIPPGNATPPAAYGAFHKSTDSSAADTTSPQASPNLLNNSQSFFGGATGGGSSFATLNMHSDQQSMYSMTANSLASSATLASSSNHPSSSSYHAPDLVQLLARRIRCMAYVKRCLSAAGHPPSGAPVQHFSVQSQSWLDTIRITRRSLESYYQSDTMRKRAGRYYILGCSFAPAMELSGGVEFARAVLAVINEVDTLAEGGTEKDKTKMRNFFKSSIRNASVKRSGGGGAGIAGLAEYSSTFDGVAVGGPSLSTLTASGIELIGTHIPFQLDFLQTTITFLDILQEVYCKFTLFLSGGGAASKDAEVQGGVGTSAGGTPTGTVGVEAQTTPLLIESINKVDVRIKKMLATLCKELDTLARHLVRQELASLDPQLARDLGAASWGGDVSPSHSPSFAPSVVQQQQQVGLSPNTATTNGAAGYPNVHLNTMHNSSAPNLLMSTMPNAPPTDKASHLRT